MAETENKSEEISAAPDNLNQEIKVSPEISLSEVNHVDQKQTGKEKIICEICGSVTTYRDYAEHQKITEHQQKFKELKKSNRKERKIRVKENKKIKRQRSEQSISAQTVSSEGDKNLMTIKEVYYIREGYELTNFSYMLSLSTFWAMLYSFSDDDRDFKLSINNSAWNEFGDIVIEFFVNKEITEIKAVQCKQILSKNHISVSGLAAENGMFSIKSRCDILKELRKKRGKRYEKTYFLLYTVSNLLINKDSTPKITYDEETINKWKSIKKEKEEWKHREVIIPEYRKIDLLNTTDDPYDICIFKIVNHNDVDLNNDLNKFSMYTNQVKLDGLKSLITTTLTKKFNSCKDTSDELIKFVEDYFKKIQKKGKLKQFSKLSKNAFLLKLAELLLKPFQVVPENIVEEKALRIWNDVAQIFDVVVLKNQSAVVHNIYAALNTILSREIEYSYDSGVLKIEKSKITNEKLKSALFSDCDDEIREVSLPHLYLKLWEENLAPLVLSVSDKNDLDLIMKVINFVKEKTVVLEDNKNALNVVLVTDLKVSRKCLSKHLKIFFNLSDVQEINSDENLKQQLMDIQIEILDFSVALREIVESNYNFLETVTTNDLFHMLLKDYAFKDINDYTFKDFNVPMTDESDDNILVLSDDAVEKIKTILMSDGTQSNDLFYEVCVNGKAVEIQVPPNI